MANEESLGTIELVEVVKSNADNENGNGVAVLDNKEVTPMESEPGETTDASETGLESGELVEPVTKKAKLDVLVPENYEDEEEDFPDEWKGEGDEDEEDEGFAVSIDDVKPRIDFRKNLISKKNIDFNEIPEINGVPVNEFNIDTLEDKPWKKPGVDISDYFNYGFNEETWKLYCDKQRRMRSEAHILETTQSQISTLSKSENSKYKDASGGQSSQDQAPFRAQFRRRQGPDAGGPGQRGTNFNERKQDSGNMMPPMMMPMGPGMPFLPGGLPSVMMHPMGPAMNMMMRPGMMGRMDDRGSSRQDMHHQRNIPQHEGGGIRRQLTTVVRIDTSGNPPAKDSPKES